ncbi:MAG: mitochondrial matrix Mmp37-domain-containing protein [Olpidium bornovanus]|uniref:Phosphatidate cytidylyltransferase, mitochondrial n=1 Tax=Olpidium bornovanus TaxID=278681 RepID=A0A8H7ZMQ5_9FUNG|nr:MAG: mitochondrial matrix Mmp37-domain-containing protein [Olpidium bornovanus]
MPTAISPLSKTAGGLLPRGGFSPAVLPRAARGAGAALPHGPQVRRCSLAPGAAAERHFAGPRRSPQSRSSPSASQKSPQFHLVRRRKLRTVPAAVAAGASRRRYHAEPRFPSLAAREVNREEPTATRLRSVVDTFRAPVRFAFAYGSGARAQKGYDPKVCSCACRKMRGAPSNGGSLPTGAAYPPGLQAKPMTDFIFGVTHPQHWHSLNLTQNPGHYSSFGRLGSRIVTLLQERIGAGVYFNPYVHVNGMVSRRGFKILHRERRGKRNCPCATNEHEDGFGSELCRRNKTLKQSAAQCLPSPIIRKSNTALHPLTTYVTTSRTGTPSTSPVECTSR